jgi:hypothetical protein
VPKCKMGKARALIARFEARLRAQRKQAGTRVTGETQEKKGRGRPWKQV